MRGRKQWNKQAVTSSFLDKKPPKSLVQQGLEGSTAVGKDEVGSSNLPSSSKKHRKLRFSVLFCCKNAENGVSQDVGQLPDPHRDPHNEMCGKSQRAPERRLCLRSGIFAPFFCLHDLRHEAAHRLCGFVLLLPRSVGVGAECESSVIVAEHTADGFDVHAILQCQRCEGVSEVVKSDVRQPGVLQDLLVQIYDGVWVVHLTGCRRGEHVGILGMLAVFRYQQVYGILRDRYFSDRSLRFGTGQRQFTIGIFDILLADVYGAVLNVEVRPEKRG